MTTTNSKEDMIPLLRRIMMGTGVEKTSEFYPVWIKLMEALHIPIKYTGNYSAREAGMHSDFNVFDDDYMSENLFPNLSELHDMGYELSEGDYVYVPLSKSPMKVGKNAKVLTSKRPYNNVTRAIFVKEWFYQYEPINFILKGRATVVNSHQNCDFICAKAKDDRLVVYGRGKNILGTWKKMGFQALISYFDNEYFLCLPKHEQALANLLNGGYAQVKTGNQPWSAVLPTESWDEGAWYMQEDCESRIAPHKEKRWIIILDDGVEAIQKEEPKVLTGNTIVIPIEIEL